MRPIDSENSDAGWGKVPQVKVPLDGTTPPATSSSASATQQAQAQGAADQASATANTLNPPPFYASMVDRGGVVSQPWAMWFNKFWQSNGGATPSVLSLQVQEAYDAIPAPVRHPDQFDYPQAQREAQPFIDYSELTAQVARLRGDVTGLEVAVAYPTPVKVGSVGLAGVDEYSTSEVLTNKTWLGQPVYRKVIDCGAMPNNTTKTIAHGITGLTWIKSFEGVTYNGTYYLLLNWPAGSGGGNQMQLAADATNFRITTYADISSYTTTYVTIEYTK